MVKIEGHDDCTGNSELNVQEATSSCSQLKLNLLGMGFSQDLIDKAIEIHGTENTDLLLETLLTLSAIKSPETQSTNSVDDISVQDVINDSINDESLNIVQEVEELESSDLQSSKRIVLSKMNFSDEDIKLALCQVGEKASVAELVDFIVESQRAKLKDDQRTTFEDPLKLISNQLLEMGFSEDEVSLAIDSFGPETPICELADSIFAKRIAYDIKEIPPSPCRNQQCSTKAPESNNVPNVMRLQSKASSVSAGELKRSGQDVDLHKLEKLKKLKKEESSNSPNWHCIPVSAAEPTVPDARGIPPRRSIDDKKCHYYPSEPPYLLYGNATDIPDEAWQKLSRFLFGIEPEFMNSEFFSALTRKEGFLHNLPTENRTHTLPGSPTTIQEALPSTAKNWPSWDTRKKLHGITSDATDIGQCCERLSKILKDFPGVISPEKKADILQQCKAFNLLWKDEHTLVTLAPDDAERILGYPFKHTQLAGVEGKERLKALQQSFQTDLLGYLLSPLKPLYPQGLRVLSVFSGIGGAEIALSKLGIPLRCVISIEASEINRQILKKWWDGTQQSGYLRQLSSIQWLSSERIRGLIEDFGGFDLVIAGNPYTFNKAHGGGSVGLNFTLYFEFVRLFQTVRGIMVQKK